MKFSEHLKTGTRIATPYLVILYLLIVALDLETTFLASPDLKYEHNWYVRHFHLGWAEIITFASFHALVSCFLFLISVSYIHNYYRMTIIETNRSFISEVFHNKKLLLSYFFFGYLYCHLFSTAYIVINNYMGYVYLFKKDHFLWGAATSYIGLQEIMGSYFSPAEQFVFIVVATLFTINQGKRILNKYRTILI